MSWPTDKSIIPQAITKVWPIASIASAADCCTICPRLSTLRYSGSQKGRNQQKRDQDEVDAGALRKLAEPHQFTRFAIAKTMPFSSARVDTSPLMRSPLNPQKSR